MINNVTMKTNEQNHSRALQENRSDWRQKVQAQDHSRAAGEDAVVTEKQKKNFWRKIRKTETCWIWTGCKNNKGYGQFSISSGRIGAHRFSWKIHNTLSYDGLFVCHKCDNPSCVNPDHLFLGTALDNNRDRIIKGRSKPARGEAHGSAKLTERSVREIRLKYAEGRASYRALKNEYGVSIPVICYIIKRKIWSHLLPD